MTSTLFGAFMHTSTLFGAFMHFVKQNRNSPMQEHNESSKRRIRESNLRPPNPDYMC